MRIGLTGATGFLGRYLIDSLINQGHEVIAWCRDPAEQNPLRGVTWVAGRLGEDQAAHELAAQSDAIVHAGFFRTGQRFMGEEADPVAYFDINLLGTLKLLEAAKSRSIKRFVFVSSGAVHHRVVPDRPLDENHPHLPASLYGAYKAAGESLISAYGLSGDLDCCTIRPTAIYGIADPIESSKWFDLVQSVARGETVQPTGGSKEVHASDVAKAITTVLQSDQAIAGETYNCSDRLISHYEVAEIAKRLSGSCAVIEGAPKTASNTMSTTKLQSLGMSFGGTPLLEQTIAAML